MMRDLTHVSYKSVWLKSRTFGRWRELTHAVVAGGLSSRKRFFGRWSSDFNWFYTFFFIYFYTFLDYIYCSYNLCYNVPYKYTSKLHNFLTPASHILSSSLSPPINLILFLVFVFLPFWGKKRPIEG